jgi:glycosyltransferase involved in cell wall biosynthesis/ribosomal protein S18 acetylase RimI-like enzyme
VTTADLSLRFLVLEELRRLRSEGYSVTTVSAPGPWVAAVEGEGFRHIPWRSATRRWDPAADVRAFRELLAILRREAFDLVHTHTPKAGVLGRLAAAAAGVPCVVNTVHGFYARPEDRLAKRALVLGAERLAARFSSVELFQNASDLDWARRLRLAEPGRLAEIGNGVDLDVFDPACVTAERRAELRAELGADDETVVVGSVCRLVAEKGVRELVAVARSLRAEGVRVVIVGGAEPDKADAVRAHELDGVHVTGMREDVRDLLAAMDVFVLASRREGLPRAVMEAAAMGKPLVLTDIRGCRELADDGVEALFVPPRDPARLTDAVRRLARDRSLRDRLGAAARARALARFDHRRVLDALVGEYGAVLARAGLVPGGDGLRRAVAEDTPHLARLHADALPDAFMSRLGRPFLARFYRALVADPDSVVVAAEREGSVVGFAAASVSTRDFTRRFALRHGLPAALAALRPSRVRGVLESARYASGGTPGAELVTVVVDPAHRRRGIARALVESARRGLDELGATELRVFTSPSNDGMNGLAVRLGFRPSAPVEVHDGVTSNVWVASWRS